MPQQWEYRDERTGQSLGSASFATPEEAQDHARRTFKRPVLMRPVNPLSGAKERFGFGAAEAITGPVQLLGLAGGAIGESLRQGTIPPSQREPGMMGGAKLGMSKASGVIGQGRNILATALGMSSPPDPNTPDLAVSLGRGAGGIVYGPRTLATVAGSVGGELADYTAQSSGMGPLGRMMASVVGDVGATQLAGSAANRTAVKGAASAAWNHSAVRAYQKLKVLDIVPDGAATAIRTANARAERMMDFEKRAWGAYEAALKKSANRTGTGFNAGIATIDPTDLMREANYIWTKTPAEARDALPDVVKSLVARSKNGFNQSSQMTIADLRGFHEQINELWRVAVKPTADPFLLGKATVADQLREPIFRAYESLQAPPPVVRNLSGSAVQRGPTAGVTAGTAREVMLFPSARNLVTGPKKGTPAALEQSARDQANALRIALESSRQTGGELNRLKEVGAGIGSGVLLEPRKVVASIVGGKGQVESPEIAKDLYRMVVTENPKDGPRQMAQTYYDYVIGDKGDFTVASALDRLNNSRAVGHIWADDERVKHLERIIRWTGDKKHPSHAFAEGTMGRYMGLTGAMIASGGRFPTDIQGAAASLAGYAAGEAIPRAWVYVRDRFGAEGQRMLARELLLDRDKYVRFERIAAGIPKPKDLEWVNLQMRALALRQSNNASQSITPPARRPTVGIGVQP